MNKTLRISFSLRNTYKVNSILYALKQIPLLKRILPDTLYRDPGFKILANVLSVFWEILSVFLGKLLYFLIFICGLGMLYTDELSGQLFLHILVFLTLVGAVMNTSIFNPTRDKYYALILMRMNAREYTLVNYGYSMLKVIVGFLPFSILFGSICGVQIWLCILIPFSVAGVKVAVAAFSLWDYERRGTAYNENKLSKLLWVVIVLLLAAAYVPPVFGMMLPEAFSIALLVIFVLAGLLGARKITSFKKYKEMNKELLSQMMNQMDTATAKVKQSNEKLISTDATVTSNRKGFEYLNELFIKRHQKILWKSTKRIACVCLGLVAVSLIFLCYFPKERGWVNEMVLTCLPYFAFVMYIINRGTGFTRALFLNCDHSLLNYSFYKRPELILKLFRIRLREIIKINAVPALIIGVGLALVLYVSGGTEYSLNYVVLIVSVLCMSVFFSVHYLTIYYLLQPYNVGTELKSGTYQLVMALTYLVCYFMMQLKMSTLIFGIMTIVFCVLYSVVACVLVYRFAPKTFRFRT